MIRVGIVGFGYWGPNLVRNFSIPGRCQAVAVADLDPAMLKRALEKFPGIATTSKVEEFWSDSKIDVVAIATPVSSHFSLARGALNAGKHVFVEKPIAETSEQAKRLIEIAASKGRVLMIDHTFVYTPAVQRIRQLVQTGALGRIYYYDSQRINLGLFQHDVNVLWDLAVHDLSILDYVLDAQPYAVSAVGMRHLKGTPENVAYMSLFLPDDIIAHINVNWLAPVKVRRTLISGSEKMLVFDDLEVSEKLKIYDRGVTMGAASAEARHETLIGYRTGDMWAPNLAVTEALHTAVLHFLTCIELAQEPITGGEMGLRLVQILELATVSMSQRGAPIRFPGK